MDQLASGIPLRAPKGNLVALPGTWAGGQRFVYAQDDRAPTAHA